MVSNIVLRAAATMSSSFLTASGVEHFITLERGHDVNGAVDRLDERGVSLRHCGLGRLAEPVLGDGDGARTDEFTGRNGVPRGGPFDQTPLGIGEAD